MHIIISSRHLYLLKFHFHSIKTICENIVLQAPIYKIVSQLKCFQSWFAVFSQIMNSSPVPCRLAFAGKRPAQLEPTYQKAEASLEGGRWLHPCESWLSGRWLPAWTGNFPPFAWGLACDDKSCPRSPAAIKKKPKLTLWCQFPSIRMTQGWCHQYLVGEWLVNYKRC